MAYVWQSALGVIFTFALYAPVVNTVGPRPEPMIVWPEQRARDDEDDGGPNGGLKFSPRVRRAAPGGCCFSETALYSVIAMADMITARNLTKKYGDFIAVDGISFTVRQGETFGILGPNGAGKTTTLEMIEGLKAITSGQVSLDGKDVAKQSAEVKHVIGVQLQASSFFDGLNLKELVDTFAALYGRTVDAMKLLKDVQLDEKWKNMVKELSGGQKQRLSIAVALVNDPKVLFLDEPTTGLDPQARRNLWDLVNEIKRQGKTIVLTTHYMEEAEVLCDRIAIMDHAKIIALDTPAGLLKLADVGTTVEMHVDRQPDLAAIRALPGVDQAVAEDHAIRITTKVPEKVVPAVFAYKAKSGINVTDIQMHQATLEDVFLKLTGRSLRE